MLLLGKRLAECNTTLSHTYKIMLVIYIVTIMIMMMVIYYLLLLLSFGLLNSVLLCFRGLRVSSGVKLELSDIDLNIEKGKANIS